MMEGFSRHHQQHVEMAPPAAPLQPYCPPQQKQSLLSDRSLYCAAVAPCLYDASTPSSYGVAAPQGSYGATVAPSFYGATVAPSFYGTATTPARVVLHELVTQLSSFQMETNQHFDRVQESMLKINQNIQRVSTMFSSHGDGLVPISKETCNIRLPNVHSEPSQGFKEIKNIVLEEATSEFLSGLKGIKNIEGAPRRNVEDPFYVFRDNKASNVILEELCRLRFDLHFSPLKPSTRFTTIDTKTSPWTICVFDPGGLDTVTTIWFDGVAQQQLLSHWSPVDQDTSSTTTFVFDPGGCAILTQLEAPSITIDTMYIIWVFDPGGLKRCGRRFSGRDGM